MISAVVIAKNEEKNIYDCLKSLKWCSEIIVIDDNSTDKTFDIAKEAGAKVFARSLAGDFSEQRNFGLKMAASDWVLFIDADERVSDALSFEILERIKDQSFGFFIPRVDFLWGRKLKFGETRDIKLLRLARKGEGGWVGKVHERWKIKGKTSLLKNPILHFPHPTTTEFLKEINFYTTLRAKELYQRRVKVYWFDIILYPKAKFVYNYFIKMGFRDYLPGLVFAIMMSFHSFLVRGKLWHLWKKP